MQIVVLAGGVATSELGDAEQIPTSLLMVNGRPFVDWQLDRFAASGARSLVMCVGLMGDQIETHVRRALDRGLAVGYSYDGGQLLGTGGALRRAFARLETEFVLTYGDRYLPFDYGAPLADLRAHPEAVATLSAYPNRYGLGESNVALDGEYVLKYATGAGSAPLDHVDCGAIALRRSALADIADGAVWDIQALFRQLVRKRQMRACVAAERFYEVDSPAGRHDLEQHLKSLPAEQARAR
ncbi:MAG TPA: sugar phosphate nucleotidyltransferase [Polyangiaceae bacterium]|nr:sugar phosphate nucleotidyltransferase [Polyangiaceae bacterium]